MNMAVEYKFDKQLYMHGACQCFAIQAAEMFHGKVCLWLDRDYTLEEGKDIVLCHAFAKIADGFYVDAYGPFSDISQRENEFEFNEQEIVECTVEEAKKILKSLKVPFTNAEGKRNAREFLRNNMLTFDYFQNGYTYTMGICAITNVAGNPCVLTYSYDIHKKQCGSYVHTIPLQIFINNIQNVHGFVLSKGWYYKK